MRRFILYRHQDETGISGIGIVAEGVRFSDGRVVLMWLTRVRSVVFYDAMEDVIAIHGHQGKTEVRWIDDEPQPSGKTVVVTSGKHKYVLE